jgi:tetratricopeptide (TPR) repeat protein
MSYFRNRKIRRIYFFFLLAATPVFASDFSYRDADSGNVQYEKGNYSKAVTFYNQFLSSGYESSQLYYNLGNSYYRLNEIGKSILYYEKALKLSPSDPDIKYNLALANQKITDRILQDQSLILKDKWQEIINLLPERGWTLLCIIFVIAGLLFLSLYFSFRHLLMRKISFWSSMTCIVLCFVTFYLANLQYRNLELHDTGIIVTPAVTVKGSPYDNALQLFLLHEGTKVWIVKSQAGWMEVKLSNGNQGWLPSSDIALI